MRLAVLLQHYFAYGGLQRDAVRLARAATSAGHDVTLLVSTTHGDVPDDVAVVALRSGGSLNHRKHARFANDCQPWLGRFDATVAFSRVPGAQFHFCGDPCMRDRLMARRSALVRFLPRYRFVLKNEDAVFGTASKTHIFFLAPDAPKAFTAAYGLGAERYTVLPPWLSRPTDITRTHIRTEFGFPDRAPLALFVGSNFEHKGLRLAIEATGQANACLLVCGDDDFGPYANIAPAERVRFIGPRDDVPRLMRGADLLVLPSTNETAGMVLTEALSYSLPVICTRNCGYAPYVANAGCPVVPANPSVEALAGAISSLLSSREQVVAKVKAWADDDRRYNTSSLMLEKITAAIA